MKVLYAVDGFEPAVHAGQLLAKIGFSGGPPFCSPISRRPLQQTALPSSRPKSCPAITGCWRCSGEWFPGGSEVGARGNRSRVPYFDHRRGARFLRVARPGRRDGGNQTVFVTELG